MNALRLSDASKHILHGSTIKLYQQTCTRSVQGGIHSNARKNSMGYGKALDMIQEKNKQRYRNCKVELKKCSRQKKKGSRKNSRKRDIKLVR